MGRKRSSEGSIDRKKLLWIVTELCRIANKKLTLSILHNVVVENLAGGQLTLRVTDMNLDISVVTDWVSPDEFRVLVDANRLKMLLRLDGETVSFSFMPKEGGYGELIIGVGDVTAKLSGLDLQDYPAEPTLKGEKTVANLRDDDLADIFGFAGMAMSTDETRYHLNGLHLNGQYGRIEAVDGHRCHLVAIDAITKDVDIILPTGMVGAIQRVLKKTSGPKSVSVTQSGVNVVATVGSWKIISKMIEGKFPFIVRVDVKDSSLNVVMVGDGKKITKLFRHAKKLAYENQVKLDFCKDGVVAIVGDPDDGDLTEIPIPLSVEVWDEPDMNILVGFNIEYFLQAISYSDDQVKVGLVRDVELKGPSENAKMVKTVNMISSPMIVTPRKGWRALVMPMRLT